MRRLGIAEIDGCMYCISGKNKYLLVEGYVMGSKFESSGIIFVYDTKYEQIGEQVACVKFPQGRPIDLVELADRLEDAIKEWEEK